MEGRALWRVLSPAQSQATFACAVECQLPGLMGGVSGKVGNSSHCQGLCTRYRCTVCCVGQQTLNPNHLRAAGRHHRYIFEEKESKAKQDAKQQPAAVVQSRLQELGPRFTLKLLSLQKGTFDSKYGEFEWVHKKEMDTSRRRFHL